VSSKALPPPLPPETRTVGQVVAEAIRLYGRRYRLALPLGLPLAAADTIAVGSTTAERIVVLLVAAPAFTLAFAWASAIAGDVRPGRTTWIRSARWRSCRPRSSSRGSQSSPWRGSRSSAWSCRS
jgi:hypothetical protein